LRGEIYRNYPYTPQDDVPIVLDGDDSFIGEAASAGYDPYLKYILLGKTVTDGIFGWIRMGINTSASYPVSRSQNQAGNCSKTNVAVLSLPPFRSWEKMEGQHSEILLSMFQAKCIREPELSRGRT
jgi:hypothetical protein